MKSAMGSGVVVVEKVERERGVAVEAGAVAASNPSDHRFRDHPLQAGFILPTFQVRSQTGGTTAVRSNSLRAGFAS